MFGKAGEIVRVVLPPTRTIALVEYREGSAAQQAFKRLAYKPLHHVPLFLEWAPADIFTQVAAAGSQPALAAQVITSLDDTKHDDDVDGVGQGLWTAHRVLVAPVATLPVTWVAHWASLMIAAAITSNVSCRLDSLLSCYNLHDCLQDASVPEHPLAHAADAATPAAPSATVYVKNLAFATADAALRQHFDSAVSAAGGVIRSAVVHKSQASSKLKGGAVKKADKPLSAGYGFVECSSEDVARAVIRRMQVGFCAAGGAQR